ncbi:MAG: DUF4914 family protein [Candidatus Omnitrophota bacterium]|nr:DUF4914 family protein [Candidatus Omnitrophota bacterium]
MKQADKMLNFAIPENVRQILEECPGYKVVGSVPELVEMSCGADVEGWSEVAYDIPGKGRVVEARVCRVRNGVAANYVEPYMRRRDPDCLLIGDDMPTDKPHYRERFGTEFTGVREKTFDWFKTQELVIFPFIAGVRDRGMSALVVAPANAGFFALGLALLQGILAPDEIRSSFSAKAVVYVAPPFRHTHFGGKQVIVHNRQKDMHELFSYNLYPGPSAKKGIYGMLLNLGEQEKWVTAHCSTVQVITPYENKVTIMHEGASGGGKSEMLEHIHRERDGRLLLGTNLVTGEDQHIVLPRGCELRPVTDDMALCHPSLQKGDGKLGLTDAENAWFVRVNHIEHYGIDPHLEETTMRPAEPLLFLNIDAVPGSTALIWEHIQDAPGKSCPNPRVVLPRKIVTGVVNGPVQVDIRSFGVRTPPCTQESPSYGIIGLLHVLPPALAWLWRLVAPRGYDNPSVVETEGMSSEGVGSYWPFATGKRVDQANLLLKQIIETPRVRYVLCPNQHIGAWRVGFMPQWIAREYLARRGGAEFTTQQIVPSRSPLLGYAFNAIMVEGQTLGNWFFQVDKQPEVGEEGYDRGAGILKQFFHEQLNKYLDKDLMPLGRKIIDCCLSDGAVSDYIPFIESSHPIARDDS